MPSGKWQGVLLPTSDYRHSPSYNWGLWLDSNWITNNSVVHMNSKVKCKHRGIITFTSEQSHHLNHKAQSPTDCFSLKRQYDKRAKQCRFCVLLVKFSSHCNSHKWKNTMQWHGLLLKEDKIHLLKRFSCLFLKKIYLDDLVHWSSNVRAN